MMLSIPDLVHSWNVEIEFHRILDHNKFNNEARMQRMMNAMHECRKQRKNAARSNARMQQGICHCMITSVMIIMNVHSKIRLRFPGGRLTKKRT